MNADAATIHLHHFALEILEKFEKRKLEQESKGIYQYVFEPVEHTGKRFIGEKLEILLLQNSG